MATEPVKVLNEAKNTVLGDRIAVAETSFSRAIGLLGKRCLEPGTGLLIVPSQAVHTVAMRFPIDVIFLDREWRVVYLRQALVPYRVTRICWKARSVLEVPVGVIAETSTSVGDQLSIE